MSDLSVAIYSANIGNYRNELKYGLDNVYFDKDIDYFFFTDDKTLYSENWKIIHVNLLENLDFMNSTRHTSKRLKFLLPEVLQGYDIIVWIDTKNLKNLNFSKNKILELFEKNQYKEMFLMKHVCRKTAQEELNVTMKLQVEHIENGTIFLNEILDTKFDTILPDTTCMVYKNNNNNREILQKVYETLLEKGLRRDQNVIQYVLLHNNYENKISYFKFIDLYGYRNIYGVYFISCINNYLDVVKEQLNLLKKEGLYNVTNQLLLFICQYDEEKCIDLVTFIKEIDIDNKCIWITTNENLYEKFAINNYKKYITDEDYLLYYFHTKGVSRTDEIFHNRRKILNFYTITNCELNIELLKEYDTVGCSLCMYPKKHYSGNFWWSKSEYLKKLSEPINNHYLSPEMYICSYDHGRFISLSNTTNNGMIENHLYRWKEEIHKNATEKICNNEKCKNIKY
jgi:hypothetical protein